MHYINKTNTIGFWDRIEHNFVLEASLQTGFNPVSEKSLLINFITFNMLNPGKVHNANVFRSDIILSDSYSRY
jgi:hypothetical protein